MRILFILLAILISPFVIVYLIVDFMELYDKLNKGENE